VSTPSLASGTGYRRISLSRNCRGRGRLVRKNGLAFEIYRRLAATALTPLLSFQKLFLLGL